MSTPGLLEICLLPPLAIARFGNSPSPMDNFDAQVPEDNPLGWRKLVPAQTLQVDEASGEVRDDAPPKEIRFRDEQGALRPVAPFFEVWTRVEQDGALRPLSLEELSRQGMEPADLQWSVQVANHKMFRRTRDPKDKVNCEVSGVSDHHRHELKGGCENFLPEKTVSFGWVQFIKPTSRFPQIRFRFTPAAGRVYGPQMDGKKLPFVQEEVYRRDGPWVNWGGFNGQDAPLDTNPGGIFASNPDGTSRGLLDDACDGIIRVEIRNQPHLRAFARIMSGPPAFAPDCLPIRRIIDELEMHLLGPENTGSVHNADVREILRRAFETVRLMNTAVMNGNLIGTSRDVASDMPGQDTNDYRRLYAPIMATGTVDNLAVQAVHENLLSVLEAQVPPWFAQAFREYVEVGDLTDAGRRRMPAMMRGADGRYLALSRRQLDTIRKACVPGPGDKTSITPLHKNVQR